MTDLNLPLSRRRLAALMAASLATPSLGACAPPKRLDRTRLGPVTFADSFDDGDWRKRYVTRFSYGDPNDASSRISHNEEFNSHDYASPDVVTVQGGAATLRVRQAKPGDNAAGAKWLMALLTTEGIFQQRYGYFECRFSAPPEPGLWPAFWLYDEPVPDTRALPSFGAADAIATRNWRNVWSGGLDGELDVVEVLTNDLRVSYHSVHVRKKWASQRGGERLDATYEHSYPSKNADLATGPHTYGVLWDSQEIAWYRDDIEVARCPNPGLHERMYLLISMGTGGWNNNKPDPNMAEAKMVVQSVAVHALKPA